MNDIRPVSVLALIVIFGIIAFSAFSGFDLSGDVQGPSPANTVTGIQNVDISDTAPTDGQVLAFSSGNSQWEPTADAGGHVIQDEGSAVTVRPNLDFIGAGITCSDNPGNDSTECSVSAGGGATITVQEGDVTVSSAITVVDFGAGFDVSEAPGGEANVTLDTTELGSITFGSGSGFTHTFDAGASDPVFDFASGVVDLTIGELREGGVAVVTEGLTITSGNGLAGGGDLSANRTLVVDHLTSGADADSTTTTSDSGLEFVGGQLTVIRGCSNGQILEWDETTDAWICGTDDTGAGGSAIVLDLGDDAGDDSLDLSEIATTGDTNNIFTEPSADKLLIAVGLNWPTADTADALSANGGNCSANQFPLGVDAAGAVEGCTADDDQPDDDSEVPDAITVNQITTGTFDLDRTDPTTNEGRIAWDATANTILVGEAGGVDTFFSGAHTTDTSANTVCTGTTTYLDGDGNCDTFDPIEEGELDTEAELETQLGDVTDVFTNNDGYGWFKTINAPAGTDPVADGPDDTLNLTVTGTGLTITGTAATDTINFDVSTLLDTSELNTEAELETQLGDVTNVHTNNDTITFRRTALFSQSGDLTTTNDFEDLRLPNRSGATLTAVEAWCDIDTAGTTSSITIQFVINGSTNMLTTAITITAGNFTDNETSFADATVADDEYIVIDITAVDSGNTGADIVCGVEFNVSVAVS